jgi:hypothetical protein
LKPSISLTTALVQKFADNGVKRNKKENCWDSDHVLVVYMQRKKQNNL